MFITGSLYQSDYHHPNQFKSRDFIYGIIATSITFALYLIAYFLLVIREKEECCNLRLFLGYLLTAAVAIACLVLVLVFTYKIHDDTDVDYTNLVNH